MQIRRAHPASMLGLLIAFAVSACAATGPALLRAHAAGKGQARDFEIAQEGAWQASRAALRWNHVGEIEEHPDERYLFGTAPTSVWTWGATMGVWLEKPEGEAGDTKTRVRVVVSRRFDTNVNDHIEAILLDDIGKAVALERRGLPLPASTPE